MTSSNFIAKGADGYDSYMGRWSRRLAPLFLDFSGTKDGEKVLDVGCGTGSLTFSLVARCNIAAVEAIDFEEAFVAALNRQNTDPRIGTCTDLEKARAARTAKARIRANDLAPIIGQLQSQGIRSLRGIAAGLNASCITAPRGGKWSAAQVRAALGLSSSSSADIG